MKKLFFIAIALFTFSFAEAQTRFGLKGGINYSNIAGDLQNQDIYQNKIGFNGGIQANFPIIADGFLSLQPELLYSQKGYQYRDEKFTILGVERERKGKVNYNYLDLPVLLKVNAGGLYFEGGPQLSYLMGIRDNTEEKIGSSDYKNTTVVDKDHLAELEIGYAAGLGFQATNGVSLGIRYNGGINKLAKDNGNDELTNARNSVFQLQLGYLLGGR
ncbi:MAG: hypothetical protein JWQ14_3626 [Adhaeribacter sp.]|nr:hypothetical protein [Adhaeribacter sp.]